MQSNALDDQFHTKGKTRRKELESNLGELKEERIKWRVISVGGRKRFWCLKMKSNQLEIEWPCKKHGLKRKKQRGFAGEAIGVEGTLTQ